MKKIESLRYKIIRINGVVTKIKLAEGMSYDSVPSVIKSDSKIETLIIKS